jgi:CRISPR system Cascade subunit CasD
MAEYLVVQLYGPMAAWGDIAVGGYRPSFAHPSKSAIIGLLAAALGIRRDEEERQKTLAEACTFAVRVDVMGTLLRDYHTAQVPPEKKGVTYHTRYSELARNLNTILSSRDYRCDSAYTVAVGLRDGSKFTLQRLSDKLRKPDFTLYLGRKSCPLALPLNPKIVSAVNFKEALREVTLSPYLQPLATEITHVGIYWDDGITSGFEQDEIHVITRRDTPLSRKRWQFSERREYYASVGKEETPCTSA